MESLVLPIFLVWGMGTIYFIIRKEPPILIKLIVLVLICFYALIYQQEIAMSWDSYASDWAQSLKTAVSLIVQFVPFLIVLLWIVQLYRFFSLPSFERLAQDIYILLGVTIFYWTYHYFLTIHDTDILLEFFYWLEELLLI